MTSAIHRNSPAGSGEAADGVCSILHLIPRDNVGGAEVAARAPLGVNAPGCRFELLVIAGPTLAPAGSAVTTSRYRSALDPRAQLHAVRRALRARPDVLIASLWQSVPAAMLIRLLRPRTRLVFMLHSEKTWHPADTIFSRLAMHAADMVWADSGVTLAGRRLPARKPRRIISFVMRRLTPLPGAASAPAPRFVSWARISPEKGMDRALQLIADLRKRGVDARFDVWGPDGGELTRLERLRLELGLGDSVRFRGPARHEDLPEIAAGHSFFLQLSRFEGMAMAAVEAMQLGLVPVVTPVGQMAEYVREGLTGIVVDAADIAGAADRLTRLLADPATFRSMREMVQERWRDAPLYADDVCSAAADLCGRRVEGP